MKWVFVLQLILLGCASESKRVPATAAGNGRDCSTPLGELANGASAAGFAHPVAAFGDKCESGTITCRDGVWTGVYIHPACEVLPTVP
jgi:hypothetical protein